jgi:phage shock protein PspC (stress-responsive transcriptional regulator)/predicted membrane protein
MTENTATPPFEGPSAPGASTPLFVRAREGRMVAGVCAGIAQRWGLDLALVRIVTVAAAVVSGVGVAAYVAAWLLTPSTDGPAPLHAGSPAAQAISRHSARLGRKLPAILLIVLAGLVLAGLAHAVHFGAPIGLLIVLGLLAFVISSRRARWVLATIAALLALALATVGVFGVHFGTRNYAVTSVDELQGRYDYGAGRINLDLSALPAVTGHHHTEVRLGRGDVVVTVPAGVPVVVHGRAGVGSVTIDGRRVSGVDAEQTRSFGTAVDDTSADRLDVDVIVGAGSVDVRTG